MFISKKKLEEKDELIRFLVSAVQKSHNDYNRLMGDYDKLANIFTDFTYDYKKLNRLVMNYIECGASRSFMLLCKEHMIGEESEVILNGSEETKI